MKKLSFWVVVSFVDCNWVVGNGSRHSVYVSDRSPVVVDSFVVVQKISLPEFELVVHNRNTMLVVEY